MALKMTARHFDRFLILRRRFGTIKQTQVIDGSCPKNIDCRQVSTPPHERLSVYPFLLSHLNWPIIESAPSGF
jgi:hypothetical protein